MRHGICEIYRRMQEDGSMDATATSQTPAEKARLGKKGEDKKQFDTPIPRPTTDLGFWGIRHKRAEFDSRAPGRRRDVAASW